MPLLQVLTVGLGLLSMSGASLGDPWVPHHDGDAGPWTLARNGSILVHGPLTVLDSCSILLLRTSVYVTCTRHERELAIV
jgi:hypothetical protein